MAAELLAQIGFLGQWKYGRSTVLCPQCSHKRRGRNQKVKCMTLWVEADGIGWNCHHCGDKGRLREGGDIERHEWEPAPQTERVPLQYVPWGAVWATVKEGQKKPTVFHTWFAKLVGEAVAAQVFGEYCVGATRDGLTVFWLVDSDDNARQPRLFRFKPDGDTDKDTYPIYRGNVPKGYQYDDGYRPCLYGEHLLPLYPNAPVCLVESEKTALIGRALFPEWVWVSLCSASNYNRAIAHPLLAGRLIFTLFDPDEAGRKCGKELRLGMRSKLGINGAVQEIDTWPGHNAGYNLADYVAGWQQGEFWLDLDNDLRFPLNAPSEMWHTFWRFVNTLNEYRGHPRLRADNPSPPFLHLAPQC